MRMHVQTDPTDTVSHVGASYVGCGHRAEGVILEREHTPRLHGGADPSSLTRRTSTHTGYNEW
jgi:hypothetical protein